MFSLGQKASTLYATGSPQVKRWPKLKHPHRLNFYDSPPLDDVTIEEFELWAIDRLRILAEIESSFARNRQYTELKDALKPHLEKYLKLNSRTAGTVDLDAERRKDHVSHFVLRLAFCRSEDLRRRFVKAETTLFRMRYDTDDRDEKDDFLNSRDFDWIAVNSTEKEQYRKQLMTATAGMTEDAFEHERYYKVKWTRVPDLIERRKVFLKGGWAYVPSAQQSSIVFQEFQVTLEKGLDLTAKALPRLDEDSRLIPVLENLSQGFLAGVPSEWSGAESAVVGDEIRAEMVDEISRQHYPMCMRNLHDTLRRDRHLKHYGRLQYGLFLKVLGLSIEEAIVFWRRSFSNLTDDKFNKEYKYNIRHSFGLEGKRANYPAKSCQQILTQDQPGPNDSHGCPYRHFALDNLQTALLSTYGGQGLSMSDLPEIVTQVKGKHFHVACTRVYEITHAARGVKKGEGLAGESVTHPNQYAAKSRELEKPKEAAGKIEDDAMKIE